jgi:hypothetical protein
MTEFFYFTRPASDPVRLRLCGLDDAEYAMKQSFIDSLQHRVPARAMCVCRGSSSPALQVEAGDVPLAS